MQAPRTRFPVQWAWIAGLSLILILAAIFHERWWPTTQQWVRSAVAGQRAPAADEHAEAGHDDHEGHAHEGHDHAHDEANSLTLSAQAQRNLGLTPEYLKVASPGPYMRTVTVPAMIVERPGRSHFEVSTPMAGVITHVHAVAGEALTPGTLLFELRITGEELVSTQTELLKTIGELDVENREIERLRGVTEAGAVPQKTMLERQYAKEKLEVLLAAQREALRLHGISERQIDEIAQHRRLLRDLQIVAPGPDEHVHDELRLSVSPIEQTSFLQDDEQHPPHVSEAAGGSAGGPELILQDVLVHKGETVAAGATLAVLSDYSELYIEGRAFEQDVDMLSQATVNGWKVQAVFEGAGGKSETVPGLDLVYSASTINVESRSLPFYVRLPNQIVREVPSPNGQKFVEWKYRLGQRLQLRVPVEEWTKQIVLPVDAIAREGAESFVFIKGPDHFDRVSVHVIHRDSTHVVIANDGALKPGNVVALRGAHQMQMALKNKSGGAVDPHAGHNH